MPGVCWVWWRVRIRGRFQQEVYDYDFDSDAKGQMSAFQPEVNGSTAQAYKGLSHKRMTSADVAGRRVVPSKHARYVDA